MKTVVVFFVAAASLTGAITRAEQATDVARQLEQGTLIVQVNAAANNDGYIDISLLTSEQQFSGELPASLNCRQRVIRQRASCTFADLAHGDYALFAFHDENDNHKLDENFLGTPTEKLAISAIDLTNNSSPSFAQSKFGFQSQVGQVFINLQ